LFWAVVSTGLAVWLFWLEHHELWRTERVTEDGLVVHAVADSDWDGESPLIASYLHPSGRQLEVVVEVWDQSRLPVPGANVSLAVAPADPTTAMVVGDDYRPSWIEYALLLVPALVAWAMRRWSIRRSTRVAGSVGPAFQMRAVASSPGWWSVRWRLHLYPLDAAPDALPVCTVPLIAPPADRGPRTVEVKGQPRPWGRVMMRDQESDELLWPSARCLRSHGWGKHALESGQRVLRHDRARWVGLAALALTAGGMALDIVTEDYDDVSQRDYRVWASVVDVAASSRDGFTDVQVALEWLGEPIEATVGMRARPSVGARAQVVIDPRHPDRVWGVDEEVPGGNLLGAVYSVAVLLGIAAVILRVTDRRRARGRSPGLPPSHITPPPRHGQGNPSASGQWRGLSISGGHLRVGPERRLTKRWRAVLEVEGPVLVSSRGEVRLRWDDGFKTGRTSPGGWRAWGVPGSRASAPSVTFETGAGDLWGSGSRFEITGGWSAGIAGIAYGPVSALLRYLVETPEAREGLADEARLAALLRDLAGEFSWHVGGNHLVGEPFAGDRLDVHLAAERVLRTTWSRRFDGRPVRGERIPTVQELIEPVRREIPTRIRDHITDDQIRDRLARLLRVDPWPFNALVDGP
jgi:hypothetical protein